MPNPDDRRVDLAAEVAVALAIEHGSRVALDQTTSGCPIVKVTVDDVTYNLTITRERKSHERSASEPS